MPLRMPPRKWMEAVLELPKATCQWRVLAAMGAFLLISCSGEQPTAVPQWRRVYVTNENSGDLSIIDAGSRQVVGRVALRKRPRGIVATPDERLPYISLSGSLN
jgi:YVTN family beta-propeller protein